MAQTRGSLISPVADRCGPTRPPLILLIPGLSGNREQWNQVLRQLRPSADIAYGAPLLSHAAFDHARPSVTELGHALAEELRMTRHDEIVVVAHSVGAFVALSLAREMPTAVKEVLLVNGGLTTVARFLDRPLSELARSPRTCMSAMRLFVLVSWPTPTWAKRAIAERRWLSHILLGTLVSDSALESVEQRRSLMEESGGPRLLLSLWRNRHHWREFEGYAHEITSEVTFLIGDMDPMSGETDTMIMSRMFSNSRVRVLKGVGHAAPLETAGAIVEEIERSIAHSYGQANPLN